MIEGIVFATTKETNIRLRKWRRSKIDVRVKLCRSQEPGNAVAVRSDTMSEGGMSVYASELLDVGTSVLVEFSLPGTLTELRLRALVRNRSGFRCGLEFTEVAESDRSLIRSYLRSLMEEHGQSPDARRERELA